MLSFKQFYLIETIANASLNHEIKIYNNLKKYSLKNKKLIITSSIPAGFSSHGEGDINCIYNNKPFNLEIKMDSKTQMGGTSFTYDSKKFNIINKDINKNNIQELLIAIENKKNNIDKYLAAARKIEPIEYNKNIKGIPFTISKDGRDELKNKGLLKDINTSITTTTNFIEKFYNNKNVYYINFGDKGLYYLSKNILNLPIPRLPQGEMKIEIRLMYSGTKKLFPDGTPARVGTIRAQGRITQNIKQSPYNLYNYEDIIKLFK